MPDGSAVPGAPLILARETDGSLTLTWGASCGAEDLDYAVYAGDLGDFTGHLPVSCGTGGATSVTLPPSAGAGYYLVVPTNGFREGSYGIDSGERERSHGPGACLPQSIQACD